MGTKVAACETASSPNTGVDIEAGSRGISLIVAVLGLVMMAGGTTKLVGESHQVVSFAMWGLPHWFLLLVGTFEVIGGALLAVPSTSPVGSLILSTIMVGAIWTHVAHAEWLRVVPGTVLLTLFLLIFRRNTAQTLRLVGAGRLVRRASPGRREKT